MTFSRSPAIAWAVSPMTGIARVNGSALSRRVASQPSTTGRLISISTRSGFSAFAAANDVRELGDGEQRLAHIVVADVVGQHIDRKRIEGDERGRVRIGSSRSISPRP